MEANKPRSPKEIMDQICTLEKELEKSKEFYSMKLVWDDNMSALDYSGNIGFFDMRKARTLLELLNDGKELRLDHSAIGKFKVVMNPQRNRILVYNADGTDLKTRQYTNDDTGECKNIPDSLINEDTIMSFIVWHAGKWHLID